MSAERLLTGKNAVITGCARGIGRSIAERFASHGANIWAFARVASSEFEEQCANLAAVHGVQVTPVCFDLTNRDDMKIAVKAVMKNELRVNVLVNNAGVTYNALYQLTSEASLREQMEVNFFSPFLLTQSIAKLMLRAGTGSVINVASTAAIDGNEGRSAYGAAKAALIAATRALSREVGSQGIRANVIAPGITETDMISSMTASVINDTVMSTDMRRIGSPSDIADVAVFLASDLSSYVTGQVLRVDGGM